MLPSWVVLVAGAEGDVERTVRDRFPRDGDEEDARRTIRVLRGSGDYVAIIQMEPGARCSGEEELARALSRATGRATYVLIPGDYPSACVAEAGDIAGDLACRPDSVALALGCTFPGIRADLCASAEGLRPIPRPIPFSGEPRIEGVPVASWAHAMKTDALWAEAVLATSATAREILAALGHPSSRVRAVAARMAACVGPVAWEIRSTPARPRDPSDFNSYLALVEATLAEEHDGSVRDVLARSVDALREWLE